MSNETLVTVRHRNGAKNIYSMPGQLSWEFARASVLEQVPSARCVLVLIQGGPRQTGAIDRAAA